MIYWKQFKSLLIHKWLVFIAGRKLDVPLWRLIIHDWGKFAPTEFFRYSQWKFGSATNKDWARGWLHHLHTSPHHPEHWVLSWHGSTDFYADVGEGIAPFVSVLPMPRTYVKEMIADMMATGYQVTGSWDISKWLNENGPNMLFHPETVEIIHDELFLSGLFNTGSYFWDISSGDHMRQWDNS